jgi:hypothetical protein
MMVVVVIVMMIVVVIGLRDWDIPVDNRCPAPAHRYHRGRRHQQHSPALDSTHRSLSLNSQHLGPEHQMPNWTTTGYPDARLLW